MRLVPAALVGVLSASLGLAAAACSLDKGSSLEGPAPHPGDGGLDATQIDVGRADGSDADVSAFDGPPPIEDTLVDDLGGPPPPDEHVEGSIGPDGGTLAGASGSKLAGVQLVVPPGALTTTTLFAIDWVATAPVPPTTAKPVTPYVRFGPEGVAFATPARVVLPFSTAVSGPLFVMSRVGVAWSALLDPIATSTTLSASLRRLGAAAGFSAPFAAVPKPTTFSPTSAAPGVVVFLDGTDFGFAPAFVDGVDGGVPFVSSVAVGGVRASPLAWSDTSISFRMPTGTDGGVITVEGPAGAGTTDAAIGVP